MPCLRQRARCYDWCCSLCVAQWKPCGSSSSHFCHCLQQGVGACGSGGETQQDHYTTKVQGCNKLVQTTVQRLVCVHALLAVHKVHHAMVCAPVVPPAGSGAGAALLEWLVLQPVWHERRQTGCSNNHSATASSSAALWAVINACASHAAELVVHACAACKGLGTAAVGVLLGWRLRNHHARCCSSLALLEWARVRET